ncbi:MAG: hypothetical protein U0X20_31775 [Caldilineaceae bacterium]
MSDDLDGVIISGEKLTLDLRLVALEYDVRYLRAQLDDLGELRELNVQIKAMSSSQPIDLSALAHRVAEVISRSRTDETSRA